MGREMIISPLALYNQDQSIFNDLQLPTLTEDQAPSWGSNYLQLLRDEVFSMDKDLFIQWLLLQTAEMSTIYPSPSIFKQAVKIWSATRYKIWQQLWETQFFRYNPIWNKDGTIKLEGSVLRNLEQSISRTDETEYHSGTSTEYGHPKETLTKTGGHKETVTDTAKWEEAHSGTDTTIDTLKHTETESYDQFKETHEIIKDDVTGLTAAFDASQFQNKDQSKHELKETTTPTGEKIKTLGGDPDKSELEHGEKITREGKSGNVLTAYEYNLGGEIETREFDGDDNEETSHTGTDKVTSESTVGDSGNIDTDNTTTEQGNIGIVSTQAMILQEREVLRFNLYEYILADFKQNFLILLY